MLANETSAAGFGQQQLDGAHSHHLRCRHVLQGAFAIYVDNTCFSLEMSIGPGQVVSPAQLVLWAWSRSAGSLCDCVDLCENFAITSSCFGKCCNWHIAA